VPAYRYAQRPARSGPVDYRAELLAAVDELPPLPRVLDRVLQLLEDSNSSSAQIAAMIEKDAVLAGNVLRCVNSAYYGLQATVTSIRHAVSMLGFATIRNQALAFSLRRMIGSTRTPPPRLYSRYSEHSLACAMLAHDLAQRVEADNAEAAFACGLFHDIGKLLILSTFPELLGTIVERYEPGEGDYQAAEMEVLNLTHSQVSRMVLEKWKLPQYMQEAVEHHHDPAGSPKPDRGPSLAAIVHAADLYVNAYGLTILASKGQQGYAAEQAFEQIGLEPNSPEVIGRFKQEYEGIRGLF
jgi:putative nucleotidyltransferase with HDIG domain